MQKLHKPNDMKPHHQARYQIFLAKLRQVREAKGLSQEEAGQRLGRNQSYVSRCESGERQVEVMELFELAEIYGVLVSDLLDEEIKE